MERPGVGVAVIVMKGNKILLGKRKGSHGAGSWACPGGHIELYEELEDCGLREVKEETGLDVRLVDKYPVAATNDFFKDENKHYVTLFIRAEYLSGIPVVKEKDKCEKWGWFCWNQLPEPLFIAIQNLAKQGYNPFKS